MESLDVLGKRAKAASRQMAKFKITKKNEVLEMVADELIKKADEIKKANKKKQYNPNHHVRPPPGAVDPCLIPSD